MIFEDVIRCHARVYPNSPMEVWEAGYAVRGWAAVFRWQRDKCHLHSHFHKPAPRPTCPEQGLRDAVGLFTPVYV